MHRFGKLGVGVPEILLPAKNINLPAWSVVACDQYTSQPEYWAKVEEIVGGLPSTLRLILPEAYLGINDARKRIAQINETMRRYLEENILIPQKPGFVYVERTTARNRMRKGLVISVDLEKYSYEPGTDALVRATEGTVLERIPPRVKIREGAPLELPHIMLLIDDDEKSVIEPLADNLSKSNYEKLYDFDLMMGGGHIKGFKIEDDEAMSRICLALEKLADADTFGSKYGTVPGNVSRNGTVTENVPWNVSANVPGNVPGKENSGKGVLLFAVGDGNHSLASAKAHWENVKKTFPAGKAGAHPARFALVEVVNVHDEGLVFEPIHRVVFNAGPHEVIEGMVEFYGRSRVFHKTFQTREYLNRALADCIARKHAQAAHIIPYAAHEGYGLIVIENPRHNLAAGTLQSFLDNMERGKSGVMIDYIHGEDVVESLGRREGNIGFFLPAMDKRDLFKTAILEGVLPRKTFSMGEAEEKRFYLECRKII